MRAQLAAFGASVLLVACSNLEGDLASCRYEADAATVTMPACPAPALGRSDCRENARYRLVVACMALRGYEPNLRALPGAVADDYPTNPYLWQSKGVIATWLRERRAGQ